MEEQEIQKIIESQPKYSQFECLCPIKDEMEVLGYYLNGKRYAYYLHYYVFSTVSVNNLWRNIEDSNFMISEDKLKDSYKDIDYQYNYETFKEACRTLAKELTEKEYIEVCDKVNKMYCIREICNKISWFIEDNQELEKFKNKVEILSQSKRIETMSLEQIRNFLLSYNLKSYTDVLESSNNISDNLTEFLENKTVEQDKGIELPFPLLDRAINGLRKGQLLATGMMSNDGKTRLMIRLASNLALKQNKEVLIISNEMTEEDIKYCFITTILNNEEFKELLGNIDITKTEKEIRNGIYSNIDELENVKKITSYLEEKFTDNLKIIHTTKYSAEDIKDIILTHYIENGVDYFFYDTLKADIDSMSNWDGLKAIATVLSELTKEYNISIWTNIQLVNRPQPLQATVDNIANSKQLYHVLDTLLLFVPLDKKDYKDYRYWDFNAPNKNNTYLLDKSKKYYICQISKNRIGAKPNLLFEVNLDKNTWKEVGQVAKYNDIKEYLK